MRNGQRRTFICIGQFPLAGCGRVLTDEERHYYDSVCEECTREWGMVIDEWRRGAINEDLDKMFDESRQIH
jgi:hypothetical protein